MGKWRQRMQVRSTCHWRSLSRLTPAAAIHAGGGLRVRALPPPKNKVGQPAMKNPKQLPAARLPGTPGQI